ncbi:uncharacterized protein LOC122030489 isoform X1 [Zingiber officinale]|uniref:uncharacterized protein LOC122030489 isoform X1 n=1 Tax=Zingiber officinale TaxID=94328 RepID=UPI001C4D9AFD|nr:uncharacterized protein LOC122030489 isoform X1 [Zingiber officinale]
MLAAMESRMSGGCQRNFGESSEEELPVLPRHAKVIVTGNDKTKSVFVGIQGLVKKAVDLGGWHWLVLTNGIEVKLQRNALGVIEAPTGNEEDDEFLDLYNYIKLKAQGADTKKDLGADLTLLIPSLRDLFPPPQ